MEAQRHIDSEAQVCSRAARRCAYGKSQERVRRYSYILTSICDDSVHRKLDREAYSTFTVQVNGGSATLNLLKTHL